MKRIYLLTVILLVSLSAIAGDLSALKPPKGANIALVVFEDLECPECARAAPQEQQAAEQYKIPVVHRDFPLQQHAWSYDAAVLANWFEKQSPKLGTEFRLYVFKNQPLITPGNLRQFADKFATEHNTQLPFVLDSNGEIAAKINADKALGQKVGIEHTPTIFIVTNTKPAIEVVDRSQMFAMIERVKQQVGANSPSPKGSKATSTTASKARARKQQ